MFYNTNKQNYKSMGTTKMGVVSCALLGNAVLAGCGNNASTLMMKKDPNNNNNSMIGLDSKSSNYGDNITSFETNKVQSKSAASEKSGMMKPCLAMLGGLIVGGTAFGVGFGVPWGQRGTEIDNLNTQVAYLYGQNSVLKSGLDSSMLNNSLLTLQVAGLEYSLDTAISSLNDINQPDHFKTLNAFIATQSGQSIQLNYSNFINYYNTANTLSLTIDQTSGTDINSLPIVAGSLAPKGKLILNLLPTNNTICDNIGKIDISGFNKATGISINGELYLPVIGPKNMDNVTLSTSSITNGIYDLKNGYFNLSGLKACAGDNSSIESADSTPLLISDTSTTPNPIVGKIGGTYSMVFNDLQDCYSDLLINTGFLSSGSINGTSFINGNFINLQGLPSNSVVYSLAANSMTDLKYAYISNAALSGDQVTNILNTMNSNNGVMCIQLSSLQGNVNMPANINLDCTRFYNNPSLVSGMPSSYLFAGSLFMNSIIYVNGTGATDSRISSNIGWYATSNPMYYTANSSGANNGGGNPVPILWNNGTSFGSAYAFTNTTILNGFDPTQVGNLFVGKCATSA